MNKILAIVCLVGLALAGCAGLRPTPAPATITVVFDLGGGGSGFAANLYAQEVDSGKTFRSLYPAGGHGGVTRATSPPITFNIDAPGTYVFYARLVEAPDDYHYGATGCAYAERCGDRGLLALDVEPGGVYPVYIADRSAPIPTPDAPVTVPWHR
jgi:hypothetical protein